MPRLIFSALLFLSIIGIIVYFGIRLALQVKQNSDSQTDYQSANNAINESSSDKIILLAAVIALFASMALFFLD